MGSNAFPKSSRLLNSKDYGQVFSAVEHRVSVKSLLFLARHNNGNESRLGLIVAKKHLKRAVDRNRIKRLIRESFRLNKDGLGDLDIIVMVRAGIKEQPNQLIMADLNKLWQKLIYKASNKAIK